MRNFISVEGVSASLFAVGIMAFLMSGFYLPSSFVPPAIAQVSTSTTQTINVTVNQTITLSLSSTTLDLGSLTPGTAVSATSSATVSTNSTTGWNMKINRDRVTSTIASGTITFPDFSAWNGSSNASTTSVVGQTIHFRIMQTGTTAGLFNASWWGSNDTDGGGALYAGFPTSSQNVVTTSTYIGTAQTVVMKVRADAPATQQATNYTGTITVTAITNP